MVLYTLFNIYGTLYQICILICFIDFMSDKEDDIEILSTRTHDNSSRPDSRNLDDRYVNILLIIYDSSVLLFFILPDLIMKWICTAKMSSMLITLVKK